MARIRTVKPELFKHEELYDLENETGLPIRLAWVGLFCIADREGRFKYRPRTIKTELFPYDETLDFSRVLHAFVTRGFISVYKHNEELYGCIPSFKRHQVINNKEKQSELPSIDAEGSQLVNDFNDLLTREPRVSHATVTPLRKDQGEGKGREGKGKGREQGREGEGGSQTTTREIWEAYKNAYLARYKVEPVRNAKINGQISQLAKRLGPEAVAVVEFYVKHPKAYYVEKMHDFGLCLSDAEALRTQWLKGRAITKADVRSYEQNQQFYSQLERIKAGEI